MTVGHDLFFNNSHILDRLLSEYDSGREIIIAFDFDDTVYGTYDKNDKHTKVIDILLWAQELGFKLLLFTVREGLELEFAIKYVEGLGLNPTYVNENPNIKSRKPFFNILLDDRCGLKQSYECLHQFLTNINKRYGKS